MDFKRKHKVSNRPRRVPSAVRIAAQKIVVKTKGVNPISKVTHKVKLPKIIKPTAGTSEGSTSKTKAPSMPKN